MSKTGAPTTRQTARASRPSLTATVLRLTAVALVAAVIVWSVLFVDVVRKRSDAGARLPQPVSRVSTPGVGQSTQAPAPVTTRTS